MMSGMVLGRELRAQSDLLRYRKVPRDITGELLNRLALRLATPFEPRPVRRDGDPALAPRWLFDEHAKLGGHDSSSLERIGPGRRPRPSYGSVASTCAAPVGNRTQSCILPVPSSRAKSRAVPNSGASGVEGFAPHMSWKPYRRIDWLKIAE